MEYTIIYKDYLEADPKYKTTVEREAALATAAFYRAKYQKEAQERAEDETLDRLISTQIENYRLRLRIETLEKALEAARNGKSPEQATRERCAELEEIAATAKDLEAVANGNRDLVFDLLERERARVSALLRGFEAATRVVVGAGFLPMASEKDGTILTFAER